jgi:hypothetical protein
MRKLNRLIAAGALAVPMALGASGIAGAEVGSLGAQDLGQELPEGDESSNDGGSGDQGAELREEGQNRGEELREEGQNLGEELREAAADIRGGNDSSNEGDSGDEGDSNEGDSDEEALQGLEALFEALADNSDGGTGGGSNPTPLG